MKIAVIGGGFAGLATAFFLLEQQIFEVTVFDKGEGGASGASSGLLHPYPGISARRSRFATEALLIAKDLLRKAEVNTPKKVYSFAGILRESTNPEQKERLLSHVKAFGDIEQVGESLFLIHSGITVQSKNYLEGLAKAVQEKGAKYVHKEIDAAEELDEFDIIVIAAGYGIRTFSQCKSLRVEFIKGQALRLEGTPPYDKSYISKGYLAYLGEKNSFEVGSTYEREFQTDAPDRERAKELLKDKLSLCHKADILECKAGVRVCSRGDYAPILTQLDHRTYVFTGLGSRGLLYHGFYGRKLAETILSKNKILS